jgi:hypothetical protein
MCDKMLIYLSRIFFFSILHYSFLIINPKPATNKKTVIRTDRLFIMKIFNSHATQTVLFLCIERK